MCMYLRRRTSCLRLRLIGSSKVPKLHVGFQGLVFVVQSEAGHAVIEPERMPRGPYCVYTLGAPAGSPTRKPTFSRNRPPTHLLTHKRAHVLHTYIERSRANHAHIVQNYHALPELKT